RDRGRYRLRALVDVAVLEHAEGRTRKTHRVAGGRPFTLDRPVTRRAVVVEDRRDVVVESDEAGLRRAITGRGGGEEKKKAGQAGKVQPFLPILPSVSQFPDQPITRSRTCVRA